MVQGGSRPCFTESFGRLALGVAEILRSECAGSSFRVDGAL